MFAPHRIIVGLNGERRADPPLVRYAAMIARIGRCQAVPQRTSSAKYARRSAEEFDCSRRRGRSLLAEKRPPGDPELRFVLLGEDREHPSRRASLRSLVAKYFAKRRRKLAVGCDLFKHRALARLPEMARDFDSDLLLVDNSAGSRRELARLAQSSPCPVWFVPPRTAPVLRRILVPIDFTHGPAATMRTAVALARCFPSAKCVALHVDAPATRFANGEVSPRRREELLDDFETLLSFVDLDEVAIEPLILERNNRPRAIVEAATNLSPDLTILSAPRQSNAVSRIFNSHTRQTLSHLTGPTLVLRSPTRQHGLMASLRRHWRDTEIPIFS
jgi:nucleotide-binding universal stress UspA family protein